MQCRISPAGQIINLSSIRTRTRINTINVPQDLVTVNYKNTIYRVLSHLLPLVLCGVVPCRQGSHSMSIIRRKMLCRKPSSATPQKSIYYLRFLFEDSRFQLTTSASIHIMKASKQHHDPVSARAEAGMRESGGNPEQYPLPYVREAAVRGVSRSLGAILRRRSVSRGAPRSTPHEPEDL